MALAVLAADRWFDLGLFPSKMDRRLAACVAELSAAEATDERREALVRQLEAEGDFSVPHLVAALDPNAARTGQEQVRRALREITTAFTYASPPPEGYEREAWRAWMRANAEYFR